jgi:hypothetical protein
MWRRRSHSYQEGGIRSRWTRGAAKTFQQVRSHGTRGDVGALLIREAGSGTARHVAASEPTFARRQGLVRHVAAHVCTPHSLS